MDESKRSSLGGRSAPISGFSIRSFEDLEAREVNQVAALLADCPHRKKLSDLLGIDTEETKGLLVAYYQEVGSALTVDAGGQPIGFLHLVPDPFTTRLTGVPTWTISTLHLDPQAPPDTLDALLEQMSGLIQRIRHQILVKVPASEPDLITALTRNGFWVRHRESLGVTRPRKRVVSSNGGIGIVPLEKRHLLPLGPLVEQWIAHFSEGILDQDRLLSAPGQGAAQAEVFLRSALCGSGQVLVAEAQDGRALGLIGYRPGKTPLLGNEPSGVVIEMAVVPNGWKDTSILERLHQGALTHMAERGYQYALLGTSLVALGGASHRAAGPWIQRLLGHEPISEQVLLVRRSWQADQAPVEIPLPALAGQEPRPALPMAALG